MILAIDFDGTVVTNRFPKVGLDAPGVEEVLKKWTSKGAKIILYTMRDNYKGADPVTGSTVPLKVGMTSTLQDAINWYKEHDIPLWAVNENPTQFWSKSRKVYANFIIDDTALGVPMTTHPVSGEEVVDWYEIDKILETK